ncbi:MAG: N-acetyltransferase, partial [Streptococcus sanguinis]|nr:N-acetyltransferase [Streptococcus sanguinis]
MKKIGTQPIETKRLLLRSFLESDAQAMYDN